ncbi:Ribosomal RNA large subunit methyltransferase H [Alteracholeplasma palmae J233]|uniref:Ribosomal RNA large subunit methyltransferase H n=1 Tax=Alteracholeplasma palmae (strain ATCC 49389 / J233) TaxID=1318466 RepID=U4KQL7_ALTPJ|nr:23S rRNA (pseudouridine(1915)-N(3))-methyltransferase RlmH [Alteracholeplasma palmae]CCV64800.1 Ribosomal RNA large subunit methyltransferase H [Alteracholeplasma palmae J233]
MIKVISVGKIKEKELTTLISNYSKQLKNFVIVEVADGKSEVDMEKEGERILSHINPNDYVIGLMIKGSQYDSVEFAHKIDKIMTYQSPDICFVIGGSYGIDKKVIERFNDSISFSKMTLPHQLMRLVLVEQIYRSQMILKNHPYHK